MHELSQMGQGSYIETFLMHSAIHGRLKVMLSCLLQRMSMPVWS